MNETTQDSATTLTCRSLTTHNKNLRLSTRNKKYKQQNNVASWLWWSVIGRQSLLVKNLKFATEKTINKHVKIFF